MTHFLISRTDNLGDVALTFPLCGLIKKLFPDAKISFLGKSYTAPLLKLNKDIEQVFSWDQWSPNKDEQILEIIKNQRFDVVIHVFPNYRIAKLCKQASIPKRVGTLNRLAHLFTCNFKPYVFRKYSDLSEAQLNCQLLSSLVDKLEVPRREGLLRLCNINLDAFPKRDFFEISKSKFNLIIHPKSNGSAHEWPLYRYRELIESLDLDIYNVIISGVETEKNEIEQELLSPLGNKIQSIVGKYKLEDYILFLSKCDGLIGASTGPIHISALIGNFTLGLFPPERPMFPLRWLPVGLRISFLTYKKGQAMKDLSVAMVIQKISRWYKLI
jgi:ADP-heptose:LPS heptosyltransferase